MGSVAMALGLSYSIACGILPDEGWNPCPLRWQQIFIHCATREIHNGFASSMGVSLWSQHVKQKPHTVRLILEGPLKVVMLKIGLLFLTKSSTANCQCLQTHCEHFNSHSCKVQGTPIGSITSPENCELTSAVESTAILKPNHIWAGNVYRK